MFSNFLPFEFKVTACVAVGYFGDGGFGVLRDLFMVAEGKALATAVTDLWSRLLFSTYFFCGFCWCMDKPTSSLYKEK